VAFADKAVAANNAMQANMRGSMSKRGAAIISIPPTGRASRAFVGRTSVP
jgi:hypothetical protein